MWCDFLAEMVIDRYELCIFTTRMHISRQHFKSATWAGAGEGRSLGRKWYLWLRLQPCNREVTPGERKRNGDGQINEPRFKKNWRIGVAQEWLCTSGLLRTFCMIVWNCQESLGRKCLNLRNSRDDCVVSTPASVFSCIEWLVIELKQVCIEFTEKRDKKLVQKNWVSGTERQLQYRNIKLKTFIDLCTYCAFMQMDKEHSSFWFIAISMYYKTGV